MFFSFQVAIPDPLEAAKEADVLIWVLPHKFVRGACTPLVGQIKPTAVALSLIKVNDYTYNLFNGLKILFVARVIVFKL